MNHGNIHSKCAKQTKHLSVQPTLHNDMFQTSPSLGQISTHRKFQLVIKNSNMHKDCCNVNYIDMYFRTYIPCAYVVPKRFHASFMISRVLEIKVEMALKQGWRTYLTPRRAIISSLKIWKTNIGLLPKPPINYFVLWKGRCCFPDMLWQCMTCYT